MASDVGLWKVPLKQSRNPYFLVPLVLHLFSERLFLLVVLLMCNLPELFHFILVQELNILPIIAATHWQQWQGPLPFQGMSPIS